MLDARCYTIQEKYVPHKTPKGSEYNSQGWSEAGWSEAESLVPRQSGVPALKGRNRRIFIAPFQGWE
jgi:hypothetical protein